eukprot:1234301-Pleurochrysis_carterae.AAC.5
MPSSHELATFLIALRNGQNTRGGRGFVKKSGNVIGALDQWHGVVVRLDFLANEEMPAFDVLGALMALRVVGEIESALVVRGERGRRRLRQPEFGEESTEVHRLLGSL